MHLSLVTPEAGLIALAGVVAVLAVFAGEQRLDRMRSLLGLRSGATRSSRLVAGAIGAVALLLTLAAMQPVVASSVSKQGRADADVYFVFDVSRSMAARTSPSAPTRLERARRDAEALRGMLPSIAIGVASLNDRLLPHLFPTVSSVAFASTVQDALGINKPRAALFYGQNGVGTKIDSVGDLATEGYFGKEAKKRIAVVFTDGETLRAGLDSLPARLRQAHVQTYFVRYWSQKDRIYLPSGTVETTYSPDFSSGHVLDAVAQDLGTPVFSGGDPRAVARTLRAALGTGPTGPRQRDLGSYSLAPWLVLLAFPFLALILFWRHLPWGNRMVPPRAPSFGSDNTRA
jgi:hypothetical protein